MHESVEPGNWNFPTSIRFGAGRISELADACKELSISNALLVTDPTLAGLPVVREAADFIRSGSIGCAVFSDIQGNPVGKNIDDGVAALRAGNHDGVIAFGGGSALDAGKAIALMAGQSRPLWDFEDREDWWSRVDVAGMRPVVAVPTTSGTGSEVGRASVITDETERLKKIIFHPGMMPQRVILDPQTTTGLPAHITAAVGMDALSHCLEAWSSPLYHPMAQGIAVEGMRIVHQWLERAVADGGDLTARAQMQVASTMGATAFQKGLGAMHSISHPCGAVLGTHHGLTNAVVMPYVLAFNQTAIDDKLTLLAQYLGLPVKTSSGFIDWVLALREKIGIQHTLADIGVEQRHVSELAPMALADPSSPTNPIPLTEANLSELFNNAITGKL